MFNWLKKLLGIDNEENPGQYDPALKDVENSRENDQPVSGPERPVFSDTQITRPVQQESEADRYIVRLRTKIDALVERFAAGEMNRKQFEDLYNHYQKELHTLERIVDQYPDSDQWRKAISDGQSLLIRRKSAARLTGYSIYENKSGLPIKTSGEFGIDSDLFVPMLHAYRSATQEMLGSGIQSSQVEGEKWICFVPGKATTTIALFSQEPSKTQLKKMQDLQNVFENANRTILQQTPVDTDRLVAPQDFFIDKTL